jgi:hypothetical protein
LLQYKNELAGNSSLEQQGSLFLGISKLEQRQTSWSTSFAAEEVDSLLFQRRKNWQI